MLGEILDVGHYNTSAEDFVRILAKDIEIYV